MHASKGHITMELDFAKFTKYSKPGPRYTSYPTALEFKDDFLYDDYIKKLLLDMFSISDPSNPEFFYKTLGSKKLAFIFKQRYNIVINHKKVYRLKKELGFVRDYKHHPKHLRKRPKNHDISKPNQYWESDIKFIPTKYDGYIPVLSIIDA